MSYLPCKVTKINFYDSLLSFVRYFLLVYVALSYGEYMLSKEEKHKGGSWLWFSEQFQNTRPLYLYTSLFVEERGIYKQ